MKSNIINLKNNRLLFNKHIIIENKNKNKNIYFSQIKISIFFCGSFSGTSSFSLK